jgi:hypothetical protein
MTFARDAFVGISGARARGLPQVQHLAHGFAIGEDRRRSVRASAWGDPRPSLSSPRRERPGSSS